VLALAAMWVIATVVGLFSGGSDVDPRIAQQTGTSAHGGAEHTPSAPASLDAAATGHAPASHEKTPGATTVGPGDTGHEPAGTAHGGGADHATGAQADHGSAPAARSQRHPTQPSGSFTASEARDLPGTAGHGPASPAGHGDVSHAPTVKGVTFVDAVMKPLHYELHERFWGWRPNDILDFTDNVNNFQLGVLEVTRRTAVILAERISRAGSTEAFDKNLENAMNSLMVTADRYWFPSPEGKYDEALEEFAAYRDRLRRGQARFWTRTDSLIPLLIAYEDLLGSCDENLVKGHEEDGTEVSFFAADDYFFYAKGVASALYEILHAVEHDFGVTIEARRGSELLHHAIESCHHAIEIDPIVITDNDLSGILANHRANMAAPISHARFYLGVLIKTLST